METDPPNILNQPQIKRLKANRIDTDEVNMVRFHILPGRGIDNNKVAVVHKQEALRRSSRLVPNLRWREWRKTGWHISRRKSTGRWNRRLRHNPKRPSPKSRVNIHSRRWWCTRLSWKTASTRIGGGWAPRRSLLSKNSGDRIWRHMLDIDGSAWSCSSGAGCTSCRSTSSAFLEENRRCRQKMNRLCPPRRPLAYRCWASPWCLVGKTWRSLRVHDLSSF